MKQLLFSIAFVFGSFAANAAEPFTPYTGVTVSLAGESCVGIDGDVFEANPEVDFFQSECVGFGGWRVAPYGGDARSYVKFVYGKTEVNASSAASSVGQFPNTGDKVEFRVHRVKGQSAKAIAALYVVSGQNPDDVNKVNYKIFVMKLHSTGGCLMAQVPMSGDNDSAAWIRARSEADKNAETFRCH